MDLAAIIVAFDAYVRNVAREELDARGEPSAGSYHGGRLPARVASVRAFNRKCRLAIDPVHKDKDGHWVVPHDIWHQAMTRRPAKPVPTATPANDSPVKIDDAQIDAMISAAGFRMTRRAR